MLNNLFINTLLLISCTFIGGHIAKELPEGRYRKIHSEFLLGVGGGILGILMMKYSIMIVGTATLVDLRSLAIMMISSVGGLVATVIAGIIIALYRVTYYGINQSSIFALIHIALYISLFYVVNQKVKSAVQNWFIKLTIIIFIIVSTFLYLLNNVENKYYIITYFVLIIICSGILEFFLLKYAKYSNELYKIYKNDATKDFLTGLDNTRQFDKLLNISFERVVESNEKLSCLMIDIDHFKKVNDTYGHPVGDLVLKELAVILKKNCRAFDYVGRVGGEEFCVLLLDCPAERCVEIGMRIRNAVKEHKFLIGKDKFISITVSIGAATYPDTVSNVEEIMERADVGLYKAKQTGRDKVCNHYECVNVLNV